MENSLDQKLDGLQSEVGQKFDNLQCSISRLASQQHVHQEEENQEEACLIDTTLEEQCKQQDEEISPLLTEEGSGEGTVEGTQKPILQPIPINLDPSAIAQPKNSLLPAASSPEPVYILPSPLAQSTPKTPTAKAKASSSLLVQNLKKLVTSIQAFATTSETLATAHTAWHNGWVEC